MEFTTKISISEEALERKAEKYVNDYLINMVENELEERVRKKIEAIVTTSRLDTYVTKAIDERINYELESAACKEMNQVMGRVKNIYGYLHRYEDTEITKAMQTGFYLATLMNRDNAYERMLEEAGKSFAYQTRRDPQKYKKLAEALKAAYEKEADDGSEN